MLSESNKNGKDDIITINMHYNYDIITINMHYLTIRYN